MGKAVVILIAIAGAVSLFIGLATERRERPPFAVGPQVDLCDLDLDLPPLRIPRSPGWDRETWRIVVYCREDGVDFRSSWDPPGADPVVRMLEGISEGVESLPDETPAFLILADGGADAFDVLKTIYPLLCSGGGGRVYVAGREADGSIGAVDLVAEPRAAREITLTGATITPDDVAAGALIRITRTAEGIHYRWGWSDGHGQWSKSRDLSAAVLPASAALEAGDGPLFPDLARLLAERLEAAHHGGLSVILETGTGTRYADVLRVVECGGADPRVVFVNPFALWGDNSLLLLELPGCEDEAAESVLVEEECSGPRVYVNVVETGDVRIKARRYGEEELRDFLEAIRDDQPELGLLFRADRASPWTECRWVLSAALELAPAVELAFREKDLQIPIERVLPLRSVEDGRSVLRVSAIPREAGGLRLPADLPSVEGCGVRLSVPGDARAGEVYQVILELVRRGAVGFSFR